MFGRLERRAQAAPMSEINMTPLIDVMLVLLIIFMVAAPLMTAALKLELPPSGQAAQPVAEAPVQLALDAKGQMYWNGEPLPDPQVQAHIEQLGRDKPEAELQLAIDSAVPYGRVALLLDQLQAAKLTRLAFATAPAAAASAH